MTRPSAVEPPDDGEERAETALLAELARLVRSSRALAASGRRDRRRALALAADLGPLLRALDARRVALAARLLGRTRARLAAAAYGRTDRLSPSPRRDRTP